MIKHSLLLSLLLATGAVQAQDKAAAQPDLAKAKQTAEQVCGACHGTDGNSAGVMPALAGMPKSKLLGTMGEFRSGAKPATIMHQISKGYTDVQLELIADYFASRAPAGGLK